MKSTGRLTSHSLCQVSFGGNVFILREAVTQQAHSLSPQWDTHNNGCDQCTQSQQRTDKEFLKDQEAYFVIDTALRNPFWKQCLNNLIDRHSPNSFCRFPPLAGVRLWLLKQSVRCSKCKLSSVYIKIDNVFSSV